MAELPVQEESKGGGIPAWMLTYSDTITLMLCFFVMMLTFSGSSDMTLKPARLGLLQGSRTPGALPGTPGANSLTAEEMRLASGHMDPSGAEKPPLNAESPLDELKRYYPDMDISELAELKGALVVRVPLVDLFGADVDLTAGGKRILDGVIKMTRGHPYSVIVRTNVGSAVPPEQRQARALLLSLRVVEHLRGQVGKACEDIGLSDDIELGEVPLPDDKCEIVMLEV